jgi:cell division protein FtsN
MAKQLSTGNAAVTEQPDLKRKLAWRMGFAGLMIVALLAALAVFDRLNVNEEAEPSEPRFTERVPVPKKEITQPLKQADPVPEAVKEGQKPAEPEVSAAPVDKSLPPVEAPPRPEVFAQPVLPHAAPHSEPRAIQHGRAVQPAQQVPVAAQTTPLRPVEPRPAAEPRSQEPAATPRQVPAPPRLFSGYALQAGVFSDPRLAEELHAKLTLNGIPSTLETRVQVGPFNSREEADAARVKLKELGIDAVMLVPPKGLARR